MTGHLNGLGGNLGHESIARAARSNETQRLHIDDLVVSCPAAFMKIYDRKNLYESPDRCGPSHATNVVGYQQVKPQTGGDGHNGLDLVDKAGNIRKPSDYRNVQGYPVLASK